MRLPFSPFQAQNVPQLAVAQPQQMPRLGAVPDVTAGVQSAMMGKQLIQLGDQIQRSVQDIGGVILQDREQKRREQQREDNLKLQEAGQWFQQDILYNKETSDLDQIESGSKSGDAKTIRDQYSFIAKRQSSSYLEQNGIDPKSELGRRITASFSEKAFQTARAVATSDRTASANRKRSEADALVQQRKNAMLLALRAEQQRLAKAGEIMEPKDYQRIVNEFLGPDSMPEFLKKIPAPFRTAVQADLQSYGVAQGGAVNVSFINKELQDFEKDQQREVGRFVFSQQQALNQAYEELKRGAASEGRVPTEEETNNLFSNFARNVYTGADYLKVPDDLKPDVKLALDREFEQARSLGVERYTQTIYDAARRKQSAVDSAAISQTIESLRVIFSDRLSKARIANPDSDPIASIGEFVTPDRKVNQDAIRTFIESSGVAITDPNNLPELEAALSAVVTSVLMANDNAEAVNALRSYALEDDDSVNQLVNRAKNDFSKSTVKYAGENKFLSPQSIVSDFVDEDGQVDNKKIDQYINDSGLEFKTTAARQKAVAELRTLVTNVLGANNAAEVNDILQAGQRSNQEITNNIIKEIENNVTKWVAEAQNDGSFAKSNSTKIDESISFASKKYIPESADKAQRFLIETAVSNHFRGARQQVIGSGTQYNFVEKETNAIEAASDLIDNPENGFKIFMTGLVANKSFDSFDEFNSIVNTEKEKRLNAYSNQLDEIYGDSPDSKAQKDKLYRLFKKSLDGIDLQEDQKYLLQAAKTEEELASLNIYKSYKAGLDKIELDFINDSKLSPTQKVDAFEKKQAELYGEATKDMSDYDRAVFDSHIASAVQQKRLSLAQAVNNQVSQELIASAYENISETIQGQQGEVWDDRIHESKRKFIVDTIERLYKSGHIGAGERVDQLIKSLRELDRNDASLLVASDPEQALDLIKEKPGGGKPGDRFHNLTVDDRLRYRSAASNALSAGLTAAKRELDVEVSNHFMKMNFLEEGGSYRNADESILNTVAQAYGAKSIETQNAVLQFSYLEDIGRNLEGEIDNIPTADLQYALEFFSPNNYQPKIGAGEAEKLSPYYNDLRRRLNGEIERRRKDPAASSWERLKAEGKGDVSYFNDGMQAGVLVTQFYMDPAFAQKSARVLPEDFVKQTKAIWDNGVESGSEQWDTVSFNSQQDIIYVRKAMAAQMLKSPLATQELVRAGVTNYAELEAYQKMDPDQLRAMENGKLDTKNTLKNLTASSYDYASRAIEDNGEVQKILNSYPFAERRNLLNLMEQHVAGQEVDDFQARIRATAAVFALGSGYAVANTKNSSEYGTVKLPAEMDAGRVSSLLSGRRFSRELVENIGVVDAYGATVKADFPPVAKKILNDGEWRWRNFTASAGQESTGLTIEILTDANTYTTLTDSSGRPVYLGFKELQDYIDSGDRSKLFTESPIKALQQWRVIGTAERIKLASQVAGPANVEPTGDGFAPIAEGMARMGNAAIGLNAKRNAALKQTAIDLLGMASPENAAALANFEFYDLVKPGSAFHNSIRPKWRDRLQKSVEQQPGE